MLTIGIKGYQKTKVTKSKTARIMQSGSSDVFATPALIALIEKTAWKSIQNYLPEGQETVGTYIEVKHIAPSPIKSIIVCKTNITNINGREISFTAECFDETEKIAEAIHKRVVIDSLKFQAKANKKTHQ